MSQVGNALRGAEGEPGALGAGDAEGEPDALEAGDAGPLTAFFTTACTWQSLHQEPGSWCRGVSRYASMSI